MSIVKISFTALLIALGLSAVIVGSLFALHSGAWPMIERRLHPEITGALANAEKQVADLERQFKAQLRDLTQKSEAGDERLEYQHRQLLAARHHILEAQQYAQSNQARFMRLALNLAKLRLEQAQNESLTAPMQSLLEAKLSQLDALPNAVERSILEHLNELIRRLNAGSSSDISSQPGSQGREREISFWKEPTAFIADRLSKSFDIRRADDGDMAANRFAAARSLAIAKNAVLTQNGEMYRLALENANLLLGAGRHADQDIASIFNSLEQLPATLPVHVLPNLSDLLDLLPQSAHTTLSDYDV